MNIKSLSYFNDIKTHKSTKMNVYFQLHCKGYTIYAVKQLQISLQTTTFILFLNFTMKEKVTKIEYPLCEQWKPAFLVRKFMCRTDSRRLASCDITGCSGMLHGVQTVSSTTSSISVPFNSTICIERRLIQFQPLLSRSTSTALANYRPG